MNRSPCFECDHGKKDKDLCPDCQSCLKPLKYDQRFRAQASALPICMTDYGRTLTPGKQPKPIMVARPKQDNKINNLIKQESKRVVCELMPRDKINEIVAGILKRNKITLECLQRKRPGRPSTRIVKIRTEIVFDLHKRARQKTIAEICGIGSSAVYNIRKRSGGVKV